MQFKNKVSVSFELHPILWLGKCRGSLVSIKNMMGVQDLKKVEDHWCNWWQQVPNVATRGLFSLKWKFKKTPVMSQLLLFDSHQIKSLTLPDTGSTSWPLAPIINRKLWTRLLRALRCYTPKCKIYNLLNVKHKYFDETSHSMLYHLKGQSRVAHRLFVQQKSMHTEWPHAACSGR